MAGPPPSPRDGDSWGLYRFQPGKGWVDKRIYQPPIPIEDCAEDVPPERDFTAFDITLEVKTRITGSLDAYAAKAGLDPADVILLVLEQVLVRDLFASILEPCAIPATSPKPCAKAASRWGPATCSTCGGPRSVISSTGLCRPCYWASKRKPKAAPIVVTCSNCGGSRSPQGTTGKCRACFTAGQSRMKPLPKPIRHCACGSPMGEFSKSCRACYQAKAVTAGEAKREANRQPQPVVAVLPPKKMPVERPVAIPAPTAPPKPVSAPRPANPSPQRPVSRDDRPRFENEDVLEEVRIRAARHAARRADKVEVNGGKTSPPDPLAHEPRVAAVAGPGFSPEFLAQLAKVAAGKGIVRVVPVPSRFVEGGSGSSLGDVG